MKTKPTLVIEDDGTKHLKHLPDYTEILIKKTLKWEFSKMVSDSKGTLFYMTEDQIYKNINRAVEEYKNSLLEKLNARMRKYADTPLSERRNAFDELYEFEKDILLTPKGLDKSN